MAASLLLASVLFMARVNSARMQQPQTVTPKVVLRESNSQTTPAFDSVTRSAKPANSALAVLTTPHPMPQKIDQATLWKQVKRGDINAEVNLAKTYLDSSTETRNCEQAHLLLLAASKNRSKEADDLLSGTYTQRCP